MAVTQAGHVLTLDDLVATDVLQEFDANGMLISRTSLPIVSARGPAGDILGGVT